MDTCQKKNKKKKETGRWTKQQHSRFILGLVNFGKNWKKVEELVGTRTGAQVRSHAQKFFNRLSKVKQNFNEQTEAEQEATIKAALAHPEVCNEISELSSHRHVEKPHSDPYTDEESEREEEEVKISPRILQLMKQESEGGTKPIQYKKFIDVVDSEAGKLESTITQKKTSEEFKAEVKDQVENMIVSMENERLQLKNMVHLLIAYITLYGQELKHEDLSFFEKLVKCQNKFICYNRFLDLVDLPVITHRGPIDQEKQKERKKSFTLYEQSDEFKEGGKVEKMVKPNPIESIIIPTVIRQGSKEQEEPLAPEQLPSN